MSSCFTPFISYLKSLFARSPMSPSRPTIAIAGAGILSRYVIEEFVASPDFDIVILSRSSEPKPWLKELGLGVHQTDYTTASLIPILNKTKATTLISFLNIIDPSYIDVHKAILSACQQSETCKRLIPSEWVGDCEKYPLKPGYYGLSREPFRQVLREQKDVEWTLVNIGFTMDYLLPGNKTNMEPLVEEFPIDAERWHATIRGTGDEVQSFTMARDVGRACVELCKAKEWEPYTNISGEWGTFNGAIKELEAHHGKAMPVTNKSYEEIRSKLDNHEGDFTFDLALAQIEEMMVLECFAFPKEKTLAQREKYFPGVEFTGFKDLLKLSDKVDKV